MSSSIQPFKNSAFDPDILSVMSNVFDMACETLPASKDPDMVRQTIAKVIVSEAENGERDPGKLYESALQAMSTEILRR